MTNIWPATLQTNLWGGSALRRRIDIDHLPRAGELRFVASVSVEQKVGIGRLEDTELVLPGVLHDPEVVATSLLVFVSHSA